MSIVFIVCVPVYDVYNIQYATKQAKVQISIHEFIYDAHVH